MKKIFLAVGLLVGCVGVANADSRVKTKTFEVMDGEVPAKTLKEYNSAQKSLESLRNKYVNELTREIKKGQKADFRKIYDLNCVQMPKVIEFAQDNNHKMLRLVKNQSAKKSISGIISYNNDLMRQAVSKCSDMRTQLHQLEGSRSQGNIFK